MSKDIRSFFKVVPNKVGPQQKAVSKKPTVLIDSDDDDVVKNTPDKPKKAPTQSKRRLHVLSSDSEDDSKKKPKSPAKKPKLSLKKLGEDKKHNLKPVDLNSLSIPIKQSEVKHVPKPKTEEKKTNEKPKAKSKNKKNTQSESKAHENKEFERTLKELDEDSGDTILLDNMDILDKTLEDATQNVIEKQSKQDRNEKSKDIQIEKKNNHLKEPAANTPKKAEKRQRKSSEHTPSPKKKVKLEKTDSGIDPDQEKQKSDKKRQSTGLYLAYLHRPGPKHHGEKEYPKGKPDCLQGLIFLRTGVLDSLEGEEFQNLVTDHGGRVVNGVSKKVNYVVVGDEPGPAKLEKARKYNIPNISEDQFLDMILEKSDMKARYAVPLSEDLGLGESIENSPNLDDVSVSSVEGILKDIDRISKEEKLVTNKVNNEEVKPIVNRNEEISPSLLETPQSSPSNVLSGVDNLSWTEKYKPTNIKGVIGQQDPNSNMNKLKKWLENWFKNAEPERRSKLPRPTLYNQYDGAYFKAALLSGPPGVGKTTTATLVANALQFDVIEFNASDTRSKKLLQEEISQMMKSKTLAGFVSGEDNINQKRVLLMDEVDGMAGNEDRGGIGELINFIKTASFPIICMCNNRDLPKMRTLVNHCYNLKFGKPNVAQIRGAMMSICFKEGLNIKPDALAQLIIGTGCDIRQTLNHLFMWSAAEKTLSLETVQKESNKSQKDVVFGAWDVIRKIFNKQENKDMTLIDKSRLFFYDYSFGPMFVQENYLTVIPECTGRNNEKSVETLKRRHLAADSLSLSDLIETKIRSSNNWALLESQAFMSTVLPSYYLSGKMENVRFPGWFGKNSQRNKSLRMISEIFTHARTCISGDKRSVRLDYVEPLMKRLIQPLKDKQIAGIDDTLEVMKSYSLLKDDLGSICELMTSFFNKNQNPFDCVASNVKSALTRKYNKTVVLNFAPPTAAKKKKGAVADEDDFLKEEDDDLSDEEKEDDTINNDGLIKVKSKAQAGSSKGSTVQKGVKKSSETKGKGKSKKK
ncbi:hypothetical protein ABEB36_009657 [Hypothenemus hampei]|uniref:Replication factor C subunit 1 n=1 Tax=Hypothenemus hampei TaxID=57062 RepID=A0ABD1EH07_HYPHA